MLIEMYKICKSIVERLKFCQLEINKKKKNRWKVA